MDTKQKTEKLRRYLIGQIRTAVENRDDCIGTYYKNQGCRITDEDVARADEYDFSLYVGIYDKQSCLQSDHETMTIMELFINPADGVLSCTFKPDKDGRFEMTIDVILLKGLQKIVDWLTDNGFITPAAPAPIPMTCEFGDFIQRNLPNHRTRYDTYRQSELQLFIDGQSDKDFGLTRDEAIAERDRLLYRIYAETIDAFTRLTPQQKELNDALDEIYGDEGQRERFAELMLEEVLNDTEPYHKIGRQVIDAYRDKDCDGLLLALSGWSIKSLMEKLEK